ncbi:MAG TPA: hypothetical protein VG872_03780 [Acidimicrobiia bacterium]|jgi:hypothetical protein|nr:hypothetical protein [Acidimicrobiia bacterium]
MAIYDGVVTLADDEIPVIVELDEQHIRMSAAGTEIGEWRTEDCQIVHLSDSTYAITAEDESLQFVPNQPALFAAAVGRDRSPSVARAPAPEEPEQTGEAPREAPPAQPLTMGLFYALCVVTMAMAVWSLVTILF